MTPERWQRIKTVLNSALELPSTYRAAFLDQNCASDPELRGEVESLLLAQEKAGSFLEPPRTDAMPDPSEIVAAEAHFARKDGDWKVKMEIQKVAGVIRFGAFELDRNSGELRKSGMKIHLRDQPFRILAMLLERPGEIITREEIQKALWPNDTVVEYEHSVN
ncbi:MAG TPA: winged helix-turn-helix domain-containing protein, partial [Terriglobia bacterium]|nr:winged helix-turn-helix domain-containing protein [Terriglobia bacterium]